jgi:hypothetical protein
MDPFRYFHLCNHQFLVTDQDSVVQDTIITNSGNFVDILLNNARVVNIISIKVIAYTPITSNTEAIVYDTNSAFDGGGVYDIDDTSLVDYSTFFALVNGVLTPIALPAAFYGAYLHNRIRWNVQPPLQYLATLRAVPTQYATKEYARVDCPRCQGKSWFVDILDQNGQMTVATGIDKVAQRFIKDLVTKMGSNRLDTTYGTVLEKQLYSYDGVVSDDKLTNDIRLIVSDVEDHYLTRQALELSQLANTEILVRATCTKVERMVDTPTRINVRIAITTRSETRSLLVPI